MDLPSIPPRKDADVESALTVPTVLTLLLSVTLATTGQLLLKAAMNEIGEIGGIGASDLVGLIGEVATTWRAVLGLVAFGASAVFWLVVLSRIPLSTAYPFVASSYLVILAFSTVVLQERPPLLTWGGAGLIVTGIIMVGYGGFDRGT
jgi:drug/metabolite transporter (DMT)-like permease